MADVLCVRPAVRLPGLCVCVRVCLGGVTRHQNNPRQSRFIYVGRDLHGILVSDDAFISSCKGNNAPVTLWKWNVN